MNDPLNRFFAEQLQFFRTIRINPANSTVALQHTMDIRYTRERFLKKSAFFKGLLTKHQEHTADIHQGLITLLSKQHAALLDAGKTAGSDKQQGAAVVLTTLITIYWAAATCVCTQGVITAVQPVGHLSKASNIIIRRVLAQILNRLKKQRFETHLDVVHFMESYVSGEQDMLKSLKKLFYRAFLPVRVKR